MQRITVTIDDELLAAIDKLISRRSYQNRFEAIRDLVRAGMAEPESEGSSADRQGVAPLLYIYDHEGRELAKRLTRAFHDHHDLSLATMCISITRAASSSRCCAARSTRSVTSASASSPRGACVTEDWSLYRSISSRPATPMADAAIDTRMSARRASLDQASTDDPDRDRRGQCIIADSTGLGERVVPSRRDRRSTPSSR